jgi:hypothetical protein
MEDTTAQRPFHTSLTCFSLSSHFLLFLSITTITSDLEVPISESIGPFPMENSVLRCPQ